MFCDTHCLMCALKRVVQRRHDRLDLRRRVAEAEALDAHIRTYRAGV
jgi:hypothetical protein